MSTVMNEICYEHSYGSQYGIFCLVATACKMSVKNSFTDVKHLKYFFTINESKKSIHFL